MPVVDIVTDGFGGGALDRTVQAIQRQSLQEWTWAIALPPDGDAPEHDDPRIRLVRSPSRAHALAEAVAGDSPFVAAVEAADVPGPTALERWAWHLTTFPEAHAVAAHQPSPPTSWMIRRQALERIGGFDAARPTDAARIYVPPVDGDNTGAFAVGAPHDPNVWLPETIPFENRMHGSNRRALIISTWMCVGGADKVLLDVIDSLMVRGWDTTVATTVPARHDWQMQYARRTSEIFALEEFLPLPDYARFLVYLIESRSPDVVVITNSELGYRLLPYLRSRCPETTFVDFLHSEAEHWNYGGYPRFSIEYGHALDLSIVVSQHLKNWMIDRGGEPDRIEVSYANVDTRAIKPDPTTRAAVRARLGAPSDAPIVLFAGRISEDKQPRVIAATLARLAHTAGDFLAVIAGDGPDGSWLRRAVARHGLTTQVAFTGALGHDAVIELMQAADVFFLPSRSEGISLAVYEAMACGIPVVAAAVGGQAELVTNETGVLIRRSNVHDEAAAYAEAIAGLIGSPERRRSLGAAARQRVVEHFDLNLTGSRLGTLLEHARDLAADSPRVPIPERAARAWATEAIELTRLGRLNELMWRERLTPTGSRGRQLLVRLYLLLLQVGGPVYRYGLARGWPGIPTARRVADRMLFGRGSA